eukprot:TRINITY_DN29376_c0_g1_i1.p1 TRINITY_DN29376_c0_g1~~TRINITY_DN29376_c0_g1_i1.p1  ORF type:complete len:217 (+),score=45.51 TRINITY_DN29376_c0_g1_i1:193-843(+)
MSQPRQRSRMKKKPPLAPLSTGFFENNKPVVRVEDGDRSEAPAVDPISQITPWLYLGSHRDALDMGLLQDKGIEYILNTAKECDSCTDSSSSDSSGGETPEGYIKPRLCYLKLDWLDHADESISSEFQRAFNFIERARAEGKKCLVHCRRGISRSATLVIAYLMQHVQFDLDAAFDHVRLCRSIINPNLGFVLSLETFAQQLGQPRPGLSLRLLEA